MSDTSSRKCVFYRDHLADLAKSREPCCDELAPGLVSVIQSSPSSLSSFIFSISFVFVFHSVFRLRLCFIRRRSESASSLPGGNMISSISVPKDQSPFNDFTERG
jgi:hypothetical protein